MLNNQIQEVLNLRISKRTKPLVFRLLGSNVMIFVNFSHILYTFLFQGHDSEEENFMQDGSLPKAKEVTTFCFLCLMM